MSVTLVTVSGKLPNSTGPLPKISFTLSAPIYNGGTSITTPTIAQASAGFGASAASFAVTLPANDDAGSRPSTTYYGLSVVSGNNLLNDIWVQVPASLAPSTNLLSLPILLPATNGCRLFKATGIMITKTEQFPVSQPLMLVDATLSAFTVMLPDLTQTKGRYTIKSVGTGTNVVTVKPHTTPRTIDGASSITVGPTGSGATWVSVDLISDGTTWRTV